MSSETTIETGMRVRMMDGGLATLSVDGTTVTCVRDDRKPAGPFRDADVRFWLRKKMWTLEPPPHAPERPAPRVGETWRHRNGSDWCVVKKGSSSEGFHCRCVSGNGVWNTGDDTWWMMNGFSMHVYVWTFISPAPEEKPAGERRERSALGGFSCRVCGGPRREGEECPKCADPEVRCGGCDHRWGNHMAGGMNACGLSDCSCTGFSAPTAKKAEPANRVCLDCGGCHQEVATRVVGRERIDLCNGCYLSRERRHATPGPCAPRDVPEKPAPWAVGDSAIAATRGGWRPGWGR